MTERLELRLDKAQMNILERDRKSTRLNSSHSQISYAVFCLKKKKTDNVRRCPRGSQEDPGRTIQAFAAAEAPEDTATAPETLAAWVRLHHPRVQRRVAVRR